MFKNIFTLKIGPPEGRRETREARVPGFSRAAVPILTAPCLCVNKIDRNRWKSGVGVDWVMDVNGIAFGGNSVVSTKTGPGINKNGMPVATNYS
jgi:hypothetical protein